MCVSVGVNLTHLTSLGNGKICRADKINCLVYTAHTDTHSYTNSHVLSHAWMPLAPNTVITHKHTYARIIARALALTNTNTLVYFYIITGKILSIQNHQDIIHCMQMLMQHKMVNIYVSQSSGFRAIEWLFSRLSSDVCVPH